MSSSATSPTAGQVPVTQQSYAPRRSHRVSSDISQADGDTWHERLAVVESASNVGAPKLMVRSYFRNSRTRQKVWDEPPSGASNIKFAGMKQRKAAETQMNEIQKTLEMIPPQEDEIIKKDKKSKGLFARFRKKGKQQKQVDDSQDIVLQKAIARSMQEQCGSGTGDPVIFYDSEKNGREQEQDDLEMAKALSLSETAHQQEQEKMKESELLQRAIEASKRELDLNEALNGVASMPKPEDLLDLESVSSSSASAPNLQSYPSDFSDKKLPALIKEPLALKKEPPGVVFDPYAPSMQDGDDNAHNSDDNGNLKPPPKPQDPLMYDHSPHMDPGDRKNSKASRGMTRRVYRSGRKDMQDKAGVV